MSFETITNIANAITIIWLIGEISQMIKSRRRQGNVQDAGTFSGMWVTIIATVIVANSLSVWTRRHLDVFGLPMWTDYLGLLMLVVGVLFRFYSIRYLGRYFTVKVSIQEQHDLIQTGPYKFLRHPSYTGAWIAFVGIGFVTGTWAGLIIWAFLPLIALLRRIKVEESVLFAHFGNLYDKYREHTWRLIPWVY